MVALIVVLNSGVSSSLPSNAVPAILQEFGLSGNSQKVLPTAIFLIGYCIGPLVFSPLSETIGRKPVLFWSFSVFFLATLGCTLAPDWISLLVFRVICGTMAAAPQTVVGGVYADLFSDLRSRGRAMALYMSVCTGWFCWFRDIRLLIVLRLQVLVPSLDRLSQVALFSMVGDGRFALT